MKKNERDYRITGMSCAACALRVEKAVRSLDGVQACAVNLLSGSLRVEGGVSEESVFAAVRAAGYGIERAEGVVPEKTGDAKRLWHRFLLSLFLLLPLVYLSMGEMLSLPLPALLSSGALLGGILQMILSLAVLLINIRFFVSGTRSLFHLSPSMDTLVALGAGISFLYSAVVLAFPALRAGHMLYFESAAMILTLITLGKTLEARAKGKTTDAIRALLALSPEHATVIREGKEQMIPVGEVKVGDMLVLRPGERVAVDGVIEAGEGAFDESALTGESLPVDKGADSRVFAATVNLSGYLYVRATGVGEETALSRIVKAVKDAASTKAPIAKLADRVSGVFVPFVLLLSLITLVAWLLSGAPFEEALSYAISVMVISCPCALGLATPVAITVGSGVGAKRGVLFKTAAALEETGRVSTVIFDKTGTVTKGEPVLTDVLPASEDGDGRLLLLAYSIEQKSEHPLGRAVSRYGEEKGLVPLAPEGFTAHTGAGVTAVISGQTLVGGKSDFVSAFACVPPEAKQKAQALADEGKTVLYFALGKEYLGAVAVADAVKEDSAEAIAVLKKMGVRTVMLTGDGERTARAVGRLVGVDEVKSGASPEQKAVFIREEKKKGKVAMVGDGINDAPALTEADVGVAIGRGADIAVDAADVVLSSPSLFGVIDALSLSRAVLSNIKENLFWAFFYNLIGIPLAAGAFVSLLGFSLPPAFSAAAMSLSSVTVVSNALRLNFHRFYHKANGDANTNDIKETKRNEKMQTVIYIEGMMCHHCSGRVKAALEALDGVSEALVSHENGSATVTHTGVGEDVLKQAVRAAGYTVKE